MKTVNFNDVTEKRNWDNETTKFHFNNDVIVTDRMFGYPMSDIIVYTNENTFIYSDGCNGVMKIHKLEANEVLFSHFLFNLETRTLTDLLLLEHKNPEQTDPFVKLFNDEIKHKRVSIISYLGMGVSGKKIIAANEIPIVETNFNKLKRINFGKAKIIPENFLRLDRDLEDANLPNVSKISDYSFRGNVHMKILNAPNVKEIGDEVLWLNADMKMCYIPLVNDIGSEFLNFHHNRGAIDVVANLENCIKIQDKKVINDLKDKSIDIKVQNKRVIDNLDLYNSSKSR